MHEVGWGHYYHGSIAVYHVLHILLSDTLVFLACARGDSGIRSRHVLIVYFIIARRVRVTSHWHLDRLLSVLETLQICEVLYILGLGGLASGVNGDVIGLKLHEGRRVAYLERSRVLVQLRICLLLAVHIESGCRWRARLLSPTIIH